MLIAAIAIILLVVGGVGTMSVVMQENAEVADELVAVSVHTHERGEENVDITRDSGGLQLLNAGPEIEILEYRVLDGAGTLMKSCPASLDVGASQRKTVGSTEQELKGCWDEYDDPTELFQVVTARGKVFTLSEVGSGNTTTTIIIDNSTHTVINNTITGGGVGFGFLPQIEVYEPPIKMVAWGNSTYTDTSSAVGFKRVGEVDHTVVVKASDESVSFELLPFSGEYRLSGRQLVGANDLSGSNSDWEDHGGWWRLASDLNGTEPYTSVIRLNGYSVDNILNITGYSSENATIKIVSSPNDLTQLTVDNDGFAPEVLPIDSYLNYTKVLGNSYASSYSTARNTPITHDLFECVEYSPGRGYKCHEYAYPSYPATAYTDFYAKDCDDAVETELRNYSVGLNWISVNVIDSVTAGYMEGVYNSTGIYSTDFEEWKSVSLRTPPDIECGPRIDSYYHVTGIKQNQTTPYSDTYLFGPDQGMTSSEDLLTEIHGNVTLNTGDHDVHFEGTGLFEETVDLRKTGTTTTKVVVGLDVSTAVRGGYSNFRLEAPDGQQYQVCMLVACRGSNMYAITVNSTDIAGDWKLYGIKQRYYPSTPVYGWSLQVGAVTYETTFDPTYYTRDGAYALIDTITPGAASHPLYNGDLYLITVGVNATETVMLRASDYVSPSLLTITNLPSYVPYEITYGDYILKDGMIDTSGRIDIGYEDVAFELTEPITFTYWPNSLTYVGNHHANGKSILFDTYNDRVISFPWDPADPLLYVAKAYVRMTIPVDDMSLDGIRLYNKAGQHVSYSYLTGTYNAGDEVYVPIFLGSSEIHLKINGDWVRSYIRDVQQNTRALVFGGTGSIEGVELSETATIFATKPGEVLAVVSATASGSGSMYFNADYSSRYRYDQPFSFAIWNGFNYHGTGPSNSICDAWKNYVKRPAITYLHETVSAAFNNATSGGVIAVSAYINGVLAENVTSTASADRSVSSSARYECHLVVPNRNDDSETFPATNYNPWEISLRQSANFEDELFVDNVRVSGIEAGDQIDFVIHSGASFGPMPNPMPYEPRTMSSDGSGEFSIKSGYIIIYQ